VLYAKERTKLCAFLFVLFLHSIQQRSMLMHAIIQWVKVGWA